MLPEVIRHEVRAWISKAGNDEAATTLLLSAQEPPFDVVCYHAQQTAEKYLRALLTALGANCPKTHDLDSLLAHLPSASPLRRLGSLAELTDAAISSRYPGEPEEYTRNYADGLVAQAAEVKAEVMAELVRLDPSFAPAPPP